MRLDRLITLGAVAPVGRALGLHRPFDASPTGAPAELPVLMYHSISDDPEPEFSPYYKVCTPPARFAEQMRWLADAGWQGVTLSEGLEWLKGAESGKQAEHSGKRSAISSDESKGTALSTRKPVAITFDDGFRDFRTAAFPVLERHGFSATMYVPTAFIGDQTIQFKGRECLTWSEVTDLRDAGIEFGSHTMNHPVLFKLEWTEIENEIKDSKAILEQGLGAPVPSFAYPFAYPQANRQYCDRFEALLERAGYESCATTEIGPVLAACRSRLVARYPVNRCDDRALFQAKLSGAYNWMGTAQRIVKEMKALTSRRHRN